MITLTPSGNSTSSSKFSELTVISCRLEQKLKAYCPIVVTDLGITMLLRPVQRRNAALPIFVTPSGITTLARLVQLSKALSPNLCYALGNGDACKSGEAFKSVGFNCCYSFRYDNACKTSRWFYLITIAHTYFLYYSIQFALIDFIECRFSKYLQQRSIRTARTTIIKIALMSAELPIQLLLVDVWYKPFCALNKTWVRRKKSVKKVVGMEYF